MATKFADAGADCVIPHVAARGYHIMYREQETNHCPGCGHTHWYVGRTMAECAFCSTALPLENSSRVAGGQIVRTIRRAPIYDRPDHAYAA